jgi:hypothetical protein
MVEVGLEQCAYVHAPDAEDPNTPNHTLDHTLGRGPCGPDRAEPAIDYSDPLVAGRNKIWRKVRATATSVKSDLRSENADNADLYALQVVSLVLAA